MSNRIDPATTSVQVATTTTRQTAPPPTTPFNQVLTSGANVLVAGASVVSGMVGGPVLAAAVREVGSQVVGAVSREAGGATGGAGGYGTPGGVSGGAPGPDPDVANIQALNKSSQSFSLQLLALQQDVQDENRRFTTLTNVIKSSHDTAKAAVSNIRS